MLCNAANNERLRGGLQSSSWSALEIVTGIANIAVNPTNCKNLIEADVIPVLFDIMKKGGAIEKESTANALWVLASLPHGKKKIREHPGALDTLKQLSKDPNKNIAAATERVLLRIQQQPMQQGVKHFIKSRKNNKVISNSTSQLQPAIKPTHPLTIQPTNQRTIQSIN